MTIEVKVPVLPESVEDAVVASWHKKPGDTLRRDENLVDLETDKVVLEVPVPVDGVLQEIRAASGDTVHSDQLLAIIDVAAPKGGKDRAEPQAQAVRPEPAAAAGEDEAAQRAESARRDMQPVGKPAADREGASRLSPAARRLAEEEKVDAARVPGTGRGGRVIKGDVLSFLKSGGSRLEERVKMTRLRRRIAERMKDAQNTAAILTSFNEVDLQAVMELRRRYREEVQQTHGIKLGIMSFFVKACCEALRQHPVVNASLDGDEVVYHNFQDIGIAVSTDRGLMVPVIRNAENMGMAEIETSIEHYAQAARDGSIALVDLQGGTFTITNGGVFGSLISTPLLNPPQSAILGMHAIKDRPVVVDGAITVRPMMYLALSYDHRLIDGRDAVLFLVTVRDLLEDPARMLLGL
jgi:2-oxoglutarate dehydrogenase E2 component (dihydrolipoamide succinyltransferase)